METSPTDPGSLEEWAEPLARIIARSYLGGRAFIWGFDEDDLSQVCLLCWVKRRALYREDRGSAQRFFRTLSDNAIRDLFSAARAQRRGGGTAPYSLGEPLGAGDDRRVEDLLLADEEAEPERVAQANELTAALDQAAESLTSEQAEYLGLVRQGYSSGEAAGRMGVHRSTANRQWSRIKAVFGENEALRRLLD
jgi:RNA polymerase sigma factor (sigma-70 family)